jgi:hypothetical protein
VVIESRSRAHMVVEQPVNAPGERFCRESLSEKSKTRFSRYCVLTLLF